ncbi:MAG TPA: cell division protein FtsZ [Gammaproteobacteria bacterium]|mgnify:CR=1 FL=1|nr:cell division protein FtsZ [Gammaproteobacteria bacterium]
MFELVSPVGQQEVIKVVGVGGGGCNAVDYMVECGIEGVEFISANTDIKVLNRTLAPASLQLGEALTRGLGAGANPDIGRQAAMENRDRIAEALADSDMVFITAGMGGGTGTGAAPVIAQLAKEQGILTVAVVTKPFAFEGSRRMQIAEAGITELTRVVDSLITIPNEKLTHVLAKQITLQNAFVAANQVLFNAVHGISDLITHPGMINIDFADVRTVMSETGMAMMGSAVASGKDRATEAARSAVSSPLLEDIDISGARGILVNVTAGPDLGLTEFTDIGEVVKEYACDDAMIIIGTAVDEEMTDEMRVTLVATGIGESKKQELPTKEHVKTTSTYRVLQGGAAAVGADFASLDVPAVIRSNPAAVRTSSERAQCGPYDDNDAERFEIPAFLRNRRAD